MEYSLIVLFVLSLGFMCLFLGLTLYLYRVWISLRKGHDLDQAEEIVGDGGGFIEDSFVLMAVVGCCYLTPEAPYFVKELLIVVTGLFTAMQFLVRIAAEDLVRPLYETKKSPPKYN